MRTTRVRLLGLAAATAVLAASSLALAGTTGVETPDSGVEQMGRGAAWVARADDPLAAYFNPAAMAWQATGVHLGVQLMMRKTCYTRAGADGKPVPAKPTIPAPGSPNAPAAELCADSPPFPNPQLAAAIRLGPKLAIGLAVLGPHSVGKHEWPESVPYTSKFGIATTQPAASRYLLVTADSLAINPTLSVAYAATDKLAFGAGFIWGITTVEFSNFSEATTAAPPRDDFTNGGNSDVKATLKAKDLFIPGFVLSALWQATPNLDVGAWYKWQDAIKGDADLHIESLYWDNNGVKQSADVIASEKGCGAVGKPAPGCNITDAKAAGRLKFAIPMEAKIGMRFHVPRVGEIKRPKWATPADAKPIRDPMSDDKFDVEMDFSWAHNSQVKDLELTFKPGIGVNGTPGEVPVNGNVPHNWKDTVGIHLGGEYVVLPSLLALRAGGFFVSKGQSDEYLNLDFDLAQKTGLGGGATLRVAFVDISAGFQHTFFGTIDNKGKGQIRALSGAKTAPDGRSLQFVNGGKLTQSLNEIGLGATARF